MIKMININFHFPTCKYLILFTWATLGYSQVAQWIFSKLLKLDGKCRLIISQCAQFQEIGAGPSSLPQPNIQPELPLDKDLQTGVVDQY